MHPRRGEADHGIADGDVGTRQQRAALGRTHRKAREVVVAIPVEPRHFRGLAADQGAAGFPATFGDARHDRGGGFRIELSAGKIVEEEQRFRALHHEVVDRHRHQIDADAAMQPGLDRDLDLGADAVGCRHQHRVLEAGGLEVEQPAEAADLGVGAGAGGGADHRLDEIDQPVAGIDIDARIRVSEPVFAVVHAQFQMMTAGYEEFRDPAMARKRLAHILCEYKRLARENPYFVNNDGHFLTVLTTQTLSRMEHRGIQYTVVQTANPTGWRWTVDLLRRSQKRRL